MQCPRCQKAMTRGRKSWICEDCEHRVLFAPIPTSPLIELAGLDRLPSVLALPLSEFVVEYHRVMRLHRLCDTVEIVTRYLTLLALGEVRQKAGVGPLPDDLLSALQPRVEYPTFGKWRGMLEALLKHCPRTSPLIVPELHDLAAVLLARLSGGVDSPPEHCVITLRNRLVHGGGMTNSEADHFLQIWETWLRDELLPRLQVLSEMDVCHLSGKVARRLIGPGAAEGPERPLSAALALALRDLDGHVVVLRGDRWLDLWPLLDYGRAMQTSVLGTRTAPAPGPLVYVRAQTDRLLYAALGAELPQGERLDVVATFRQLFRLESRQPTPGELLSDFDVENQADADAFIGREDELRAIKDAVKATASGVLWVAGKGGIGKSFLMAKVGHDLGNGKSTWRIGWRFKASDLARCSRVAFLRHAVTRLAGKLGRAEVAPAHDPNELKKQLTQLLADAGAHALPKLGAPPKVLFVLDGLDEIANVDPAFPLLPFQLTGEHVVWLCAGRPEKSLPAVFAPDRCTHVFPTGVGLPPMTRDDIRGLLIDRTGSLKYDLLRLDREEVAGGEPAASIINVAVDAVVARAEGLPLYVRFVVEDILSGHFSFAELSTRLPPGLEAYYDDLLKRLSIGALQALLTPLVVTIAWAREPLPEESLLRLMVRRTVLTQGDLPLLRDGLRALEPMLRVAPVPGGAAGYEPYHPTFRDHIREDRGGLIGPQNSLARESLIGLICDWWTIPNAHPALAYALRSGPSTLIEEKRWDKLVRLLLDPDKGLSFLESKAEAGLVFDLAMDFSNVVHRMPPAAKGLRILRVLREALRRDLDFIARHPTSLFQCLWNWGWWYDSPEASHHYDPPAEDWGPGGPPWDQPEPRLSSLLTEWHRSKRRVAPGHCWIRSLRPPAEPLGTALQAVLDAHGGPVLSVLFSRDGQRIFSGHGKPYSRSRESDSASHDGSLRIWDTASGKIEVSKDLPGAVRAAALSPDGRLLALGMDDGTVRIVDATRADGIACLRGHEVVNFTNRRFCTYDPEDLSRIVFELIHEPNPEHGESTSDPSPSIIHSLTWSQDGRRLVSSASDRTVRLWDTEAMAMIAVLRTPTGATLCTAFSPDGSSLIIGTEDGHLEVLEPNDLIKTHGLGSVSRKVTCVSVHRDGRFILSGHDDGTLRVWDRRAGGDARVFSATDSRVNHVVWIDVEDRFCAAYDDGVVRVWDLTSARVHLSLVGHRGAVLSLDLSPDGVTLVSGSDDSTVRTWTLAGTTPHFRRKGDDIESWRGLLLTPDGQTLVALSDKPIPNVVCLYDLPSLVERTRIVRDDGEIRDVCLVYDRPWVVTGTTDGTVEIWPLDGGEPLHRFDVQHPIKSLVPDRCGRRIACLSGHSLIVIEVNSGRCFMPALGILVGINLQKNAASDAASRVAFSADSSRLVYSFSQGDHSKDTAFADVPHRSFPFFTAEDMMIDYYKRTYKTFYTILDLETNSTIVSQVLDDRIHDVDLSPSGERLLLVSRSAVEVIDVLTGAVIDSFHDPAARRGWWSASGDETIILNRTHQWKPLHGPPTPLPRSRPWHCRFSKDEMTLLRKPDRHPVAWFPRGCTRGWWHPDGRTFSAIDERNLWVLSVEGPDAGGGDS